MSIGTEQCVVVVSLLKLKAAVEVDWWVGVGWGGTASSPLVIKKTTMDLLICTRGAEWYSIHFGYYFCDFFLVIISGE